MAAIWTTTISPLRCEADVLLAIGFEVHYQQFVGGHDYLKLAEDFRQRAACID